MEDEVHQQVSTPLYQCIVYQPSQIQTFAHTNGHVADSVCNGSSKKSKDASCLPEHLPQTALPSPKDPPTDSSLHASEQDVDTLFTEEYWRKICPQLHVNDEAMRKLVRESSIVFEPDTKKLDQFKKDVSSAEHYHGT